MSKQPSRFEVKQRQVSGLTLKTQPVMKQPLSTSFEKHGEGTKKINAGTNLEQNATS